MMNSDMIVYKEDAGLLRSKRMFITGKPVLAHTEQVLPVVLMITSYPPRQCGIATYSQDLVKALHHQFGQSFRLNIVALENKAEKHLYPEEVKYTLNTDVQDSFLQLQYTINNDPAIELVVLQHEFGLYASGEYALRLFLQGLNKPVLIVFHTVLPKPADAVKKTVQELGAFAAAVIVMTQTSKNILQNEYGLEDAKLTVIPHGTHLVTHEDKNVLKKRYGLSGKKVLSTFGLLSSGKSIETTLEALPAIIKEYPDVLFLIIGKTHPSVIKQEGEQYREKLEEKITALQLGPHVQFINRFLPLPELLEYLQLTDIYLFTSRDPNQAVSGTFAYAISCGCPVISTPIPHAREVLQQDDSLIFDFENPVQLAAAVNGLLGDEERREKTGTDGLHRMAFTAWENGAIAHALLFEQIAGGKITLQYTIPEINLAHIKKLTTSFGMIQFSVINQPDISSGYTLDDNARALIAMCQHFDLTGDSADLPYIKTYFRFIKYCLQPEGHFLNYVREERLFTDQNNTVNLADANGRAVWALGYLLSLERILPLQLIAEANAILTAALPGAERIHSTRAMAFVIKGLYYRNKERKQADDIALIRGLADRLVQMYRHESNAEWQWYESYLTYANSIIPEAMLCAWLITGEALYKEVAETTFDFLLSKIFDDRRIRVISNRSWLYQGTEEVPVPAGGEQPIDVAYTIIALSKFAEVCKDKDYKQKMTMAFSWFLGNNHLHQVIYNPCTGGCYDGLEENNVNLNQGAESTVSYLMARLTMEKAFHKTARVLPAATVFTKADNTGILSKHTNDVTF
jgi:glycosyltransferase involved in cell wall biosynthesis